jgi:hypothetical protein
VISAASASTQQRGARPPRFSARYSPSSNAAATSPVACKALACGVYSRDTSQYDERIRAFKLK